MRRYAVISILVLVVAMLSAPAIAAEGSYYVGNSSPAWCWTHYANSWSTRGFWDLTNDGAIPAGAVITGMRVSWTVSQSWGWSGMNVYLYDAAGAAIKISYSGQLTHAFDGESARQKWSSRFYVTSWSYPGNGLGVAPELTVYYSY